jgi:peptidyl-prolyl cis-trans isomerase C
MRNLMLALAAAGMMTGTAAMAQNDSPDASTVLASVNGTDITLGHVVDLYQRLPQEYRNAPDDQLLSGLLDQIVVQELLAGEVSNSSGTEPLALQLRLDNERRAVLAGGIVEERFNQPVDEAGIKALYDKTMAGFEPQPEFNAAHILVDSEDKAKDLLAAIEGGADFAETAIEDSSNGSAATGGGLGWFGIGQMVPEFEAAVLAMETGDVAGPVKTQFGWHLIKLEEKRVTAPPPLEDVREQIEAQLHQEILAAEIEKLRDAASIELMKVEIPADSVRDPSLLQD